MSTEKINVPVYIFDYNKKEKRFTVHYATAVTRIVPQNSIDEESAMYTVECYSYKRGRSEPTLLSLRFFQWNENKVGNLGNANSLYSPYAMASFTNDLNIYKTALIKYLQLENQKKADCIAECEQKIQKKQEEIEANKGYLDLLLASCEAV